MMPGTAPIHGPISGIMLNSPATMPTMSQNGRSMIGQADRRHDPDDEGDGQLAAEVAADGAAQAPGDDHHVAPGPLGDQGPRRPRRRWGRSTSR